MNHYQKSIASALAVDPETARLVEGMMRVEHPTLDHLDAGDFYALAKDCLLDVQAAPDLAARIADATGLPPVETVHG